jgi:hypothetical protein
MTNRNTVMSHSDYDTKSHKTYLSTVDISTSSQYLSVEVETNQSDVDTNHQTFFEKHTIKNILFSTMIWMTETIKFDMFQNHHHHSSQTIFHHQATTKDSICCFPHSSRSLSENSWTTTIHDNVKFSNPKNRTLASSTENKNVTDNPSTTNMRTMSNDYDMTSAATTNTGNNDSIQNNTINWLTTPVFWTLVGAGIIWTIIWTMILFHFCGCRFNQCNANEKSKRDVDHAEVDENDVERNVCKEIQLMTRKVEQPQPQKRAPLTNKPLVMKNHQTHSFEKILPSSQSKTGDYICPNVSDKVDQLKESKSMNRMEPLFSQKSMNKSKKDVITHKSQHSKENISQRVPDDAKFIPSFATRNRNQIIAIRNNSNHSNIESIESRKQPELSEYNNILNSILNIKYKDDEEENYDNEIIFSVVDESSLGSDH